MSIADPVYEQVKALPDQLAREVLNSISYLRERAGMRDLTNAQANSLAAIWDHDADNIWDRV